MPSRGYTSFFPGNTGRLNIPSSGIDEFLKGPSRSSLSSLSALGRLMSGAGYGGYGGSRATKLTAKEREELLNQSKMAQAQNAVFNNEEFRQRYQSAMQSSAAKAQQAVKDMREAYIKPIASQFGVDAGKLSDIMMGQLSAETKQRVRDVKEDKLSYAGQKALHGLTNFFTTTLGNAIPFFRTEAERDAASKRAIEESRAIDQNNAYGRDQLLRQQEGEGFLDLGSGETGSYLANMAEMIGENVPAIAATLTPAGIVSAAGNALRLGTAGLNALRTGALMGAGAGVGAAMSSEGFRQRVFSDPNLSPEQQRAALDSPEATANTALGAALGGIPFGAEGLWRMAAPRIPFTAAGRRVAADTAAQAAELTAARAAVPLAEREAVLDAGRRAALEAEAQRQAYQTMAPTFLSRAGQQARWMVPEVAAMNVGQTAGSNILYGGATGQDVPWTEGLGEAVASSIPLGLLGAGMSAASMGGRARTNFLRNFRDDGTPKITNAQLARTLNRRINNGTLGDVGTLDALRRFRADWGDEASFADVLAQVDPQYHDILGKVYNLLGKSDITAKDITAAFGKRQEVLVPEVVSPEPEVAAEPAVLESNAVRAALPEGAIAAGSERSGIPPIAVGPAEEISPAVSQAARSVLNEPKSPAGQSRTQGVGRNVTRGEAAGDAGDTATSGAVAPVARDADTQTAEPAAPADTTAGRTDESGRTGGAEAPDVRAGEVAVPAAEPDGTQPVGTRADGGRGAEPATEGTPTAGESTRVASAEGSRSENIQQSAQGAGDGEIVRAQRGESVSRFVRNMSDESLGAVAREIDTALGLTGDNSYTAQLSREGGADIIRELIAQRAANTKSKKKNDVAVRRIVRNAMQQAEQPAGPRVRRATSEDSARVGEQVRQQVEADPALIPPANRVDEPVAPATETQDAPKVIIRRKGAKNKQKEVKAAETPKTTEDAAIDDAVEKLLNLSKNIRKQHDKRMLQQTVKELEEQESVSSPLGVREVYDVLSDARANQNLTPAKLRAAIEKDLNLLYRVATEGEVALNKKQQAQYKELASLLPEGATIDQSDIQAAIAYKTSAENDGMKVSGGKALMNILGESNTTRDALDTKPTTVCR